MRIAETPKTDSSSCKENLQFPCSKITMFSIFSAISSKHRFTEFTLNGKGFKTSVESFFTIFSTTSLIASITISSEIVWGYPLFATLSEILYEAINPPSFSALVGFFIKLYTFGRCMDFSLSF